MKKCLMCEKEIEDYEEEFCETCLGFLKSKYNGKYEAKIKRFRESNKFLEKWRTTERRERKK